MPSRSAPRRRAERRPLRRVRVQPQRVALPVAPTEPPSEPRPEPEPPSGPQPAPPEALPEANPVPHAEPRTEPRAELPREEPPQGRAGRPRGRLARIASSWVPVVVWVLVVLGGLAALVAAGLEAGPGWLGDAGAVAIVTTYSWALAARTGGRPVVVGLLALVLGVAVVLSDDDALRTGAAVLTSAVSAVLAVMATVPAVRFVHVVREVLVAVLVAAVGALAVVGFEPVVTVTRFEYVTLGLALVGAFGVVYRLGAGLHGLGRRGVVTVLVGSVVLALTLAYAELLRRYGTPGLVGSLLDGVAWSREHLGAFPRPLETALGIPALAWGTHMRARRRQGWWVCAFGVAATTPVANALVNPSVGLTETVLAVAYGVVAGLLIGLVVIRLDLALTGSPGRRGRRAEEAGALRPEPSRTRPLH